MNGFFKSHLLSQALRVEITFDSDMLFRFHIFLFLIFFLEYRLEGPGFTGLKHVSLNLSAAGN